MPDQTLAQRVRAKYPGAYDDMDDQQLESAIKAKYPGVYDDLPTTQAGASKPEQGQPGVLARAADAAGDVAVGAAKGLGNTVVGLGDLAYRYLPGVKQASDAVQRAVAGDVVPAGQLFQGAREAVKPTNTAQRIGYGAEQVGEFFALPAGTGGLVAKGVTQGVGSGLLSKAQGATTGQAGAAGAIGAVLPAAGAATGHLVKPLKESAQRGVQKALGGTKERFKAIGEKVAPEFLERRVGGVTGKSRPALLEEARANARAAGQQIDAVLQQAGGRATDSKPIVDALEDAKNAFQQIRTVTAGELRTNPHLAQSAKQIAPGLFEATVVLDTRAVRQLSQLQQTITDLGRFPTVDQLVAVRRVWDKVVDQAGGYAQRAKGAIGVPLKDQAEAAVKREATTAIRKVLAQEVPELTAVNKEFAFWKSLQDVLVQTQKRTAPQRGGLGKTIVTSAGAVGGFASGEGVGDKVENALIYGTLANRLDKVFTSPRWRLVSANLKNSLADAIASGKADRIHYAVSRLASATASGAATR
jgi:hypothetical protein